MLRRCAHLGPGHGRMASGSPIHFLKTMRGFVGRAGRPAVSAVMIKLPMVMFAFVVTGTQRRTVIPWVNIDFYESIFFFLFCPLYMVASIVTRFANYSFFW